MNDTTENVENTGTSAKSAFGTLGTRVNAINYGHPHGEALIAQLKEVLFESETGRLFLKVLDTHQIPVQIMKGTGESGYSSDLKAIFVQIPGKTKKITGDIIINFAKAIREADQEFAGLTPPDPTKDVIEYAGFMHARNLDSLYYTCQMIKELTNSSFFPVLLDTLRNLGLNHVYKAYLDGKSKEELYSYYAEAYENRGSI